MRDSPNKASAPTVGAEGNVGSLRTEVSLRAAGAHYADFASFGPSLPALGPSRVPKRQSRVPQALGGPKPHSPSSQAEPQDFRRRPPSESTWGWQG